MRQFKIVESVNQFESIETIYNGFDKNFEIAPDYVAVVIIEGESEVFALDNENITDLSKFLNEVYYLNARILGVYEFNVIFNSPY